MLERFQPGYDDAFARRRARSCDATPTTETQMTTATDTYDRFASTAAEYGVELTRTEASDATAAIDSLVDEPAVGAALPWDGIALPERVTTDPTPGELDAATTGVTAASLAIADYGSLVLEATPEGAEPASLFPDRHVVVLREDDLVPDMETAFEWFGERFRETRGSAIVATGPSATADMGSLVKGAHGPKEVRVVVVA
jgi:L-lactate dehydrogenase complex protein LldG